MKMLPENTTTSRIGDRQRRLEALFDLWVSDEGEACGGGSGVERVADANALHLTEVAGRAASVHPAHVPADTDVVSAPATRV